jgi:hypothetical protein
VTKFYNNYAKTLGIQPKLEAYMKNLVLRKKLELISHDRRGGLKVCNEMNEEIAA